MPGTDLPRPLALNIDRSDSIQLCGPAPTSPFLPKSPLMGLHCPKNQAANWWQRGREHTKPDFGYEGVAMRDD
jgi:hypothetical protein